MTTPPTAKYSSQNGHTFAEPIGSSLKEIPKSDNFTSSLPADAAFPRPIDSHKAPRESLGPRLVREALFTYVRPEKKDSPELVATSSKGLSDLGLKIGEEDRDLFREVVAGNKILTWNEEKSEGIYPWAQCYGGYQFGQWAGQLGDGRAISLFEVTNPKSRIRYELQLKGAGKTPYSRFADGKAVLRSSLREFIVSEYLNAIGIPTTRALSLTLVANNKVQRERLEPGAVVARFAQTWIRLGTFDLPHSRRDRKTLRTLATYVAEEVFGGWETLPAALPEKESTDPFSVPCGTGLSATEIEGDGKDEQNRFTRLYRKIVRENAKTVAAWQAYGFMNGVLNTDNTSVYGLSIDYGPFAFMDHFDPSYTPNHDDHMLRYSYKNQPTIIWWNLVRLAEALSELIGIGAKCDEEEFVNSGVRQEAVDELVSRAENIIVKVGDEYKAVFMAEYRRLMSSRLGLKTFVQTDFDELYSELLDAMEALELDFHGTFRRLSSVQLKDLDDESKAEEVARRFFHPDGLRLGQNEKTGQERVGKWLQKWARRIREDWGNDTSAHDEKRSKLMLSVNPKFVPRSWILDEIIEKVEKKGDRQILPNIMKVVLSPFEEKWDWDAETEARFCGPVPKYKGALQCSCSS